MAETTSADALPRRSRPDGRVIDAVAVAVLAATVAGWCGRWHWLLDLASHFRWYWLLAAVAGLAACIRWPRPTAIACLALAAVGNARELLPAWLPAPAPMAARGHAEPGIVVVSLNVHRLNDDPAATLAYLRERRPDIVAVLEVDAAWAAALEDLAAEFPHRLIHPRADNFGIAVLSRWPLADARVANLGGSPFPSIVATVSHPSGDLRVVATHPMPPWNGRYAALMLDQFDAIAEVVTTSDLPCIVMGDLNATPWSHAFRRLTARSGLRDSALGHGIEPTWNARLWAPRIPIDHVLVPAEVTVLRRAVGPDVGSDHFPIEAELALPRR